MSNKKKMKFQKKYIVWIIALVQLIVSAILGYQLVSMGILPALYIVAYIAAVLLIALVTFLVAKTKKRAIIMSVLSVLISAIMVVGIGALGKLQDTMQQVTDAPEGVKTEMVIVVLADTDIETITDISEFMVGYLSTDPEENVNEIKEEINTSAGGSVSYHEFTTATGMVDALYAKTMDAIIIDNAYFELLVELEGYQDFLERTKVVFSHEVMEYMDLVDRKESNLNQFVVYISGIDKFGHVSAKSRSDVNILAVVNTDTKQIQLINTPRDYYVELPKTKGQKDKLTHAGIYGVKRSISTLEKLYDVQIDYYVRMNFSGFEALINALGGIDVYSEKEFTVEPIKHYVVGMNHLDGLEALAFARERKAFADGDRQRGRNQMAVIQATFDKITSPEILYSYTEILSVVEDMIATNLTSQDIYTLVRQQLVDMSPWTFETYAVTGTGSSQTTYSMPDTYTYVMIPDESSIEEAKEKINAILEAE